MLFRGRQAVIYYIIIYIFIIILLLMLTRKEISSTLNPSVDLQKEYESSRNKNKERKSNLIKKSTFNNNPIDLYLPIRKNAISMHKPCVTLSNSQLLSKSSSLNTSVTLPMISSKNN